MSRPSAVQKSMTREDALARGRESLRQQAWSAAFTELSAADQEQALAPEDLQGLSIAAILIGREGDGTALLARAHQGFLGAGDAVGAARCAFWLAFGLLNNGEQAQAGGWLARARRLLDEGQHDCVEQGYMLLPDGIRAVRAGDAEAAYAAFVQAAAIGERFRDMDLVTLARQGQGRALIRRGETTDGVALLDESMVAVTSGEVSAITAGGVYCSVIEACSEIFDLRRAQEWTSALEQWCAARPDVVPYRSHCLIRRAEIRQLQGAWGDAMEEAQQARERLSHPTPKPWIGAAIYRIGELHRLRGEFAEAEEAYREASHWETAPRPGLAQLRFAQGHVDEANAAIRHVADEVRGVPARARMLDAFVEIVLAANDVPAARAAAEELGEIAARIKAPMLDAVSARAMGSVLLAENDTKGALAVLRQALKIWRELEVPYEAAQVRVLIGLACRDQKNRDAAELELDAAREVFERLGAAPDLARLARILERPRAAGPLTAREVEVLRLVAAGLSNREVAGRLGVSEKTVARHVSNIFVKLDVGSRAAATAYAYQNHVV